ncbi:MAG: hypothetical protein RR816_12545, partial [Clostridia bacterium]
DSTLANAALSIVYIVLRFHQTVLFVCSVGRTCAKELSSLILSDVREKSKRSENVVPLYTLRGALLAKPAALASSLRAIVNP